MEWFLGTTGTTTNEATVIGLEMASSNDQNSKSLLHMIECKQLSKTVIGCKNKNLREIEKAYAVKIELSSQYRGNV